MMGGSIRTLNIIDEYTREALMIRVDRKLNSTDVLDALTDLFILRGPPEYIRSDNGPEFIARRCATGSPPSAPRRPTSNQAHLGRTDTAKASTPGSATSC
jgi:transposase InsO family protein